MSKKKDERQIKIRQILYEEGEVRVVDLASRLNVTPETLRKDLDELERQRIIIHKRGSVRIQKSLIEMPIAIRSQECTDEKRKISTRAFQEIHDGQVVYLDAGSTLLQGAQALRSKKDLTIIVNSFPIALEMVDMDFKVIFLGGVLQKNAFRTDGYHIMEMLNDICIDVAILGTDGIKDVDGFTVLTLEEVGTHRNIINRCRELIVVADHTKFDRSANYQYCKFREVDLFVTSTLNVAQLEQVKDVKRIIQI